MYGRSRRPVMLRVECSHLFWLASAHGHWSSRGLGSDLDALSCDEPRKGVVDRRPGTHRFRGRPKKPVALYVLFTIETSLPRDLPNSATCCVLHEVPMAGS